MSDEKNLHLDNRTVAVFHKTQLAELGIHLTEQPPNNLYGGIVTKHDVERIVERWVKAGCPDPIPLNKVTSGMRRNYEILHKQCCEDAANREALDEEHARVSGLLVSVREQKEEFANQVTRLEVTVENLVAERNKHQKTADRLRHFFNSIHHYSFSQRIRMVLSKKYFSKVYEEATQ